MTNTNPTFLKAVAEAASPPDPFSPESLNLGQDFDEMSSAKKELLTLRVRKPGKREFFRVHPDAAYRKNILLIDDKEGGETYYVVGHLRAQIPDECDPYTLYACVSRQQDDPFLWPVRIPKQDDRHNEWWASAREGAELGIKKWVRITASMAQGYYTVRTSEDESKPNWPTQSYEDLLRIAFKGGRVIDTLGHPYIRRLNGSAI